MTAGTEMLFIGVDLGWTTGATGLALLRFNGSQAELCQTLLARNHDEALDWITRTAQNSFALAAIDAPTIIRNAAGQRPGERQLNSVFRKYLLNCHAANLGRPFAAGTTRFASALEARGFIHAPMIEARRPGRYQIEVFPHASIVRLFGLEQRLRYKKGQVAERAAVLEELRGLIASLSGAEPSLTASSLPLIRGAKGRGRKDVEDQLDAILCAYTGAHYWYWGMERNQVFGDAESGYIVVPGGECRIPPV